MPTSNELLSNAKSRPGGSLFDPRSRVQSASHTPPSFVPTGFAENLDAAALEIFVNGRSDSRDRLLRDFYSDSYLNIFQNLGEELPNPLTSPDFYVGDDVLEAQRQGRVIDPREREALAEERLFNRLQEITKDSPLAGVVKTPKQIREQIATFRQGVREDAAEIHMRSTGAGVAGAFAGAFGAIATDPPILASLVVGAPLSASVARTALIEASIGGVSEAAVQAFVQTQRQEFGETPDFEEAYRNILFASLGGAAFGAAFKGIARGAQALGRRVQEDRALREEIGLLRRALDEGGPATAEGRVAQAKANNPFVRSPDGYDAHVRAFSEAQKKLRGEEDAVVPDEPEIPVRDDVLSQPNRNTEVVTDGPEAKVEGVMREAGADVRQQEIESVRAQEAEVETAARADQPELPIIANVDRDGAVITIEFDGTGTIPSIRNLQELVQGTGATGSVTRGQTRIEKADAAGRETVEEQVVFRIGVARNSAEGFSDVEAERVFSEVFMAPQKFREAFERVTRRERVTPTTPAASRAPAPHKSAVLAAHEADLERLRDQQLQKDQLTIEETELLRDLDEAETFEVTVELEDGTLRTLSKEEILESIHTDDEIAKVVKGCIGL